MFHLLLLTAAFTALIIGADLFVKGASAIGRKFGISDMVIGLTIIAFGTSAPELAVNMSAALHGNGDISIGNILGSNIANILLILGIAGLVRPLITQKNTVWKEIPFALAAVIVFMILVNDEIFASGSNLLSTGDGLILLVFMSIFLIYVFGISKVDIQDEIPIKEYTLPLALLLVLSGLAVLIAGGQAAVYALTGIAVSLGISELVIGLTITAIGTSLPELTTSVVAAYRGKTDIAIGNVVGSNIFNIFFIMGITSIIRPIPAQTLQHMDSWMAILASALLFLTMFTGKKRILDRWEAGIFILIYVAYIWYLLTR